MLVEEKRIECEYCKGMFPVKDTTFIESKMKNDNGDTMDVKYFVCPHCYKTYIVNIFDWNTKKILKRLDEYTKKIHKLRNYNVNAVVKKQPRADIINGYEESREEFRRNQKILKEKYTSKFKPFNGSTTIDVEEIGE